MSLCHLCRLMFYLYVLVCHSYVSHMYLYVIRKSLVCTCMSSVCHSYLLVCHPYVTRMWFYRDGPRWNIVSPWGEIDHMLDPVLSMSFSRCFRYEFRLPGDSHEMTVGVCIQLLAIFRLWILAPKIKMKSKAWVR